MSSQNRESNNGTRERVLIAALALLEEPGATVRIADIARQAGISRQAVYLHFASRAELLIAATQHLDTVNNIDEQLAASRSAPDGPARLNAWIRDWGNYMPQIYGVFSALMAMRSTDEAAAQAWENRMQAMRDGCRAAIESLASSEQLVSELSPEEATDWLWSLLSVRYWEHITIDCGWTQERYIEVTQQVASNTLIASTTNTKAR